MSTPEKTETVSLRLSPERLAKAEEAAAKSGVSLSAWLREQIEVGWVQAQVESTSNERKQVNA